MFWKKKSKDEEEGKKSMFKVTDQSRGAFRISPSLEEPIIIDIAGEKVHVIDISSGGASFKNTKFKADTVYDGKFNLPNSSTFVQAKIKVLRITDAQICNSIFVGLPPELEDEIHHYVLARQKEELKSRKNSYI